MPALPEPDSHQPLAVEGAAAPAAAAATAPSSTKRPSSRSPAAAPPKRRRVPARAPGEAASGRVELKEMSQLNVALERLRAVLQSMRAEHRRAVLERTAVPVRAALAAFMKEARAAAKSSCTPWPKTVVPRPSMAGDANVRTLKNASGCAYQAQLRIGSLRMYTKAEATQSTAMRHLAVLAQLRREVVAVGGGIWEQHGRFCQILAEVLRQHRTSEEALGLGVFVYMRADEWIDRSRAITTPVAGLPRALEMHSRLSRARRADWAALRAEWIPLLRCTRAARRRGLSAAGAEALAEAARRGLLGRQAAQAVRAVERALGRRRRCEAKTIKKRAATLRRTAGALASRAAEEKRLAAQRRNLERARWRWMRRTDLTTAEMLEGPPRHLLPPPPLSSLLAPSVSSFLEVGEKEPPCS